MWQRRDNLENMELNLSVGSYSNGSREVPEACIVCLIPLSQCGVFNTQLVDLLNPGALCWQGCPCQQFSTLSTRRLQLPRPRTSTLLIHHFTPSTSMAAAVQPGLVSATRIKGKAGAGLRRIPQSPQEWLESAHAHGLETRTLADLCYRGT